MCPVCPAGQYQLARDTRRRRELAGLARVASAALRRVTGGGVHGVRRAAVAVLRKGQRRQGAKRAGCCS